MVFAEKYVGMVFKNETQVGRIKTNAESQIQWNEPLTISISLKLVGVFRPTETVTLATSSTSPLFIIYEEDYIKITCIIAPKANLD